MSQKSKESRTENRLSKVLAAAGVASRRHCEDLIFSGRVKVNGEVVKTPQQMVHIEKDKISVDGKAIEKIENKVYYILNKPAGYVCTNLKKNQTKIVLDLFEGVEERLFTVGRLDKNTEGLIIVTNDGHFANQMIHPSSNIIKEYLAKTDAEISHEHLKAICAGTLVEGVFVKPVSVTKVRRGTLKIGVVEGKKHEVRILLDTVGLDVKHLSRIRIGGLHLGALPVGTWREMTETEKKLVFQK